MILDNRRITIREVVYGKQFIRMFKALTCGREDCSKIVTFLAKTTSHGLRAGYTNDDPDLLKKVITSDESCIYGYDIETKAQSSQWKFWTLTSQDRKRHVFVGLKWRFSFLFSKLAMALCIISSCHKVLQSIRNTALKLCTEFEKQFVSNIQNCAETNHGFCTIITYQLTH